ncbi:MAG: hypothetical protein QOI11_1463, partial [Candidatus Eremiobacteraeota bacterium]|nr:hypothetical protein [Candidatus Eremiobacteraeota bacterium]
ELSAWFSIISIDLRKKVIDRFTMSTLAIDHGIPRKIGNLAWSELSLAERSFVQNLLFKLCRKCNGSKSAKLIPLDALMKMYANTYYGGEVTVAMNDGPRWQLFLGLTRKVYARQAG